MFKGKAVEENEISLQELSRKERETNEKFCEFTLKKEKTEFGVCTFFRACKVSIIYLKNLAETVLKHISLTQVQNAFHFGSSCMKGKKQGEVCQVRFLVFSFS